jgi:hypothetical protein
MSRQETHTGTISKVNCKIDLENFMIAKLLLNGSGLEDIERNKEDIKQYFQDEFYDKFFFHKDELYKIDSQEIEDTFIVTAELPNGDIEFTTSFYNGGTCLTEMIESELS